MVVTISSSKENWYQPEAIASSNMLLEQAFMHLLSTTELAKAHVPNFASSIFSRILATGAFPLPPPPPPEAPLAPAPGDAMEVGSEKRGAENQLIPDDPDDNGFKFLLGGGIAAPEGSCSAVSGKGKGPQNPL